MHKKNFYKTIAYLLFVSLCCSLLISCTTKENKPYSLIFLSDSPVCACSYDLLNTVTTITIYDTQSHKASPSDSQSILNECFELIYKYELIFSTTNPNSELYKFNHGETNKISDELYELINTSLNYCRLTDGALDITLYPVTSLWDFSHTSELHVVPNEEVVGNALKNVDYKKVQVFDGQITLADPGVKIDLGSVAKGYIADKVKEFMVSKGVSSALINLGGNILTIGEKKQNVPFNIGLKKPFSDSSDENIFMSVKVKDLSVVSSGIYERFFYDENGKLYHHIIDPSNGYPVQNDIWQVSIINDSSFLCDALSTSCLVLGKEKGIEFINSIPNVYAIFYLSDGSVITSFDPASDDLPFALTSIAE